MHFLKHWIFTIVSAGAAFVVLEVEKIGNFFLFAPPDKFYIDLIISALLLAAGILLDINIRRLERERAIEKELRAANERLDQTNRQLRESMARIKVLRGLLPICASCKKVRNDKGYWQQVDVYFREHSEAEPAHWLCPECVNSFGRASRRRS